MLNQQTIEKLYAMPMRGMADAFTQQQEDPQTTQLSFEERFALLVDRQWTWRQNRILERRLREARLQGTACIEDIDFRAARGLDKQVVRSLIHDSDWVRRHQHIFVVGPTDRETLSGPGVRTEGMPRRIHRLFRHGCAVVPGTGNGAGRRHYTPEAQIFARFGAFQVCGYFGKDGARVPVRRSLSEQRAAHGRNPHKNKPPGLQAF
jgi:hypothetical protein